MENKRNTCMGSKAPDYSCEESGVYFVDDKGVKWGQVDDNGKVKPFKVTPDYEKLLNMAKNHKFELPNIETLK